MTTSFKGIFFLFVAFFHSSLSQTTTGSTNTGWFVYDTYASTDAMAISTNTSTCPLSQWSQRLVQPLGTCVKVGSVYKIYTMTLSTFTSLPERVYTQTYTSAGCTGTVTSSEEYGTPPATVCTHVSTSHNNGQSVVFFAIISYVSGSVRPGPPSGLSQLQYLTMNIYPATGCAGTVTTVLYLYTTAGQIYPNFPQPVCYDSGCSDDSSYGSSSSYSLGTCPPRSTVGGGCTGAYCKTVGQRGYLTTDYYSDLQTCLDSGAPQFRSLQPGGACEVGPPGGYVSSVVQMSSTSIIVYTEMYTSNTCSKSSYLGIAGSLFSTTCADDEGWGIRITANAKIGVPATGGPYEMR